MRVSTRDLGGAGKGVLWLSGAKLYFMLAGAILQIALPALVSRVTFGAIAVVSSLVSPVNNLVVTGSIQAVARGLAARPNAVTEVGATGLRMHLYAGLPLALGFAIAAPAWSWWLGDASKAWPTAMCALIVGAYAVYAVLVGLANGQRQFDRQAGLDVAFASMRVALMLGAALLGLGVWGVLGGWVVASLLIIIVAAAWVGWPRGAVADGRQVRAMAKTFWGLAAYLALANALLFVDTWMIKRAAGQWYQAQLASVAGGLAQAAPWLTEVTGYAPSASSLADVQVAYYGAAQNFARLIYQAMVAVAFVIFPLISQTTFRGDSEAAARYVATTLRMSLIAVGGMALGLAAAPQGLLAIPYAADYAASSARPLAVLACSYAALALLSIAATIANAAGLERLTWRVVAATIIGIIAAGELLLGGVAPGEALLLRGAVVALGGMLAGLVAMLWLLRRQWPSIVSRASMLRIATALAIGWLASQGARVVVRADGVGAIAIAAVAVAAYAVALWLIGEVRPWRRAPAAGG